jgi:hypothetical protein
MKIIAGRPLSDEAVVCTCCGARGCTAAYRGASKASGLADTISGGRQQKSLRP